MRAPFQGNFQHAGSNPAWLDAKDPRRPDFSEREVALDLRLCDFVQVPAALWCAILLLLAKNNGGECELLAPDNAEARTYLKSMGLCQVLQENGVRVDGGGVAESRSRGVVLPLTRFDDEYQVGDMADKVLDTLQRSGLGAPNIYSVVSETFGELAMNAVQHSQSPIGAYGVIQFHKSESGEEKFVCGVADAGIGIRHSLEQNPAHKEVVPYDWLAIKHALRERVSGTGDSYRGFGLFSVAEDTLNNPGQRLMIHSGIGSLEISEDLESAPWRTSLFPGTLAYVSIPA